MAEGYGRKTLPLNMALPANPISAPLTTPPREIRIAIEGGIRGGLMKANVGKDVLDLRAMLEQGLAWSIGGSAGLGSPPLFTAKKGELLLLHFENKTASEQVLHLHGHVWTSYLPMLPEFEGPQRPTVWTDTAVIPKKSAAKMYMIADNSGTWAIQSLMAERSDAGLIGAFTVADMP
jgi:FtsP/CotA-like multicopper oxidase with cupredoxin domain